MSGRGQKTELRLPDRPGDKRRLPQTPLSGAVVGYPDRMTDVVDADELLRRIRRGRDSAAEQEQAWRERARTLTATDPEGARDASVRAGAYEAVLRVLEEIVNPGRPPAGQDGVKQVT